MKTLLLLVATFSNSALTCTSHDKPDTAPRPHQQNHALAATIAEADKSGSKPSAPKAPAPAPKPAPKERDPKQARPNYLLM